MTTTRSDTALGELGRQLRELRKSARLTQADLSARAGISRDTLSRVENGGSAETAPVSGSAGADLACLSSPQWVRSRSGSGGISATVRQSVFAQTSGSGPIRVYGQPAQRNTSGRGVQML